MKILKKIIINILFYPIFIIGLFIPKSKKIWIFGSWFGNSYTDNSRYLFEYILNNKKDIIPIWLTNKKLVLKDLRNRNIRCYYKNSIKGFYYTARSYVIIVNQGIIDINKFGLSSQIKVLLWHGTPIKKIAFDDHINSHSYNENIYNFFSKVWNSFFPFDKENWDLITSASNEVKKKFITAFRSNKNSVQITGYPRYDIILDKLNCTNYEFEFMKKFDNKRIVLYAPTFRDKNIKYDYFFELNLKLLNKLMDETNSIFLIKLHPKSKNIEFISKEYSNIFFINDQLLDINIILSKTTILITDYSSIYIDFLLLNRPIIFTPFDYKNYINNRKLYYDYYKVTPGKKCDNWNETLNEINEIIIGNDNYSASRDSMKDFFHKFTDSKNSLRIYDRIKKIYG